MNKGKILILGASGFVGREILNAFIEKETAYEIYALEHTSKVKRHPKVTLVKGSLFAVPKIIENLNPEIIIHAARISGKNYRILGRRKAAFLGKLANTKICKKIIKENIKLLYISGSLMYGSHPGKDVTENFKSSPISYAIDYSKAEKPFLNNLKNASIMICRPGWIFGPDSWFKAYFEDIIKSKNFIPQYGDGSHFMSIIHGNDLGCLIKQYALEAPYSNIFNMISPIGVSHKQFVNELSRYYQKDINIISKEELLRQSGQTEFDALTCDIRLATNYTAINDVFDYRYRTVNDLLKDSDK